MDHKKNLIVTFREEEAVEFSVKILNESSSHHDLEFTLSSTLIKTSNQNTLAGTLNQGPISLPSEGTESPTTTEHNSKEETRSDTIKKHALLPLDYCMESKINPITGKSNDSEPPRMRINPNYKRTRMILKKRTDHRVSCNTKEWIKGRDAYYIRCLNHLHSGFLCVKKRENPEKAAARDKPLQQTTCWQRTRRQSTQPVPDGNKEDTPDPQRFDYKVCIKPSIESHSDEKNKEVLMLFRLQPAPDP